MNIELYCSVRYTLSDFRPLCGVKQWKTAEPVTEEGLEYLARLSIMCQGEEKDQKHNHAVVWEMTQLNMAICT